MGGRRLLGLMGALLLVLTFAAARPASAHAGDIPLTGYDPYPSVSPSFAAKDICVTDANQSTADENGVVDEKKLLIALIVQLKMNSVFESGSFPDWNKKFLDAVETCNRASSSHKSLTSDNEKLCEGIIVVKRMIFGDHIGYFSSINEQQKLAAIQESDQILKNFMGKPAKTLAQASTETGANITADYQPVIICGQKKLPQSIANQTSVVLYKTIPQETASIFSHFELRNHAAQLVYPKISTDPTSASPAQLVSDDLYYASTGATISVSYQGSGKTGGSNGKSGGAKPIRMIWKRPLDTNCVTN